jgi:hypothetical protein
VNLAEYLGVDASISGQLQWNHAFNTGSATDTRKIDQWVAEPWRVSTLRQPIYILGELTAYMPAWSRTEEGKDGWYGGELNKPYGEEEFIKYIEGMARIHIAAAPNRPYHYYKVLWEPVDWWGAWRPEGDDGDRALVRLYELAYKGIHRVYDQHAAVTQDSTWRQRAVVLGPTYSDTADAVRALTWHKRQFDLGLANYIDGLSIHPYNDPGGTNHIIGINTDFQLAEVIKALMDMTNEYYVNRTAEKYYDKPFFWGTEQGLREAHPSNGPLRQAQLLTRQNLIMKGEGFDTNYVFCLADYNHNQRYGYFYNHTPMLNGYEIYAPGVISPKMAVSAFAASSWLLKGYKSEGRINGLSGTNFGYKYADSESNAVIYALWNYGRNGSDTVVINVGANQVTVYDIVGNARTVDCPGNILTISLTEYVQYVKLYN